MNAAAGTTRSNAGSKFARRAVPVVIAPASAERIDERALDRHVNPDGVAELRGDRSANVQQRARRGDHIEQRVAAAVLDVLDLRRNRIESTETLADVDLFRSDRNRRPRAVQRLLADSDEAHVGAL